MSMQLQRHELELDITAFVDKLLASRKISLRQYHDFSNAILADGQIDEVERHQINRILDAIQTGAMKIVE
ncbi:MAG: hypothetical protein F6K19_09225 [Cyanothece sp. SIO1E1]|nr:hypothetical protein [Cyanothece sp. SIO1E1]